MVNFSRTHRATGGMRNCFPFCWELILNCSYILEEICFVSNISHQSCNSQGEWGSDREVWLQGHGSHLKVTFQSTQQVLPICLSSALSPALVLHAYLSLSLPHCYLAFPFRFLFLPSSRTLTHSPQQTLTHTHTSPLPPPPHPPHCDVLTRL